MSEAARTEKSTFATYLDVARRQLPVMAAAIVIVPVIAVLFSMVQTPEYEAAAEVHVTNSTLADALPSETGDGGFNPSAESPPDRYVATQVELARVPQLIERVLTRARQEGGISDERTVDQFLATSSVESKPATDLLVFTVTDTDPGTAAELATTYAQEFTRYKGELDRRPLEGALANLDQEIERVRREGGPGVQAALRELGAARQRLVALRSIPSANAQVVSQATGASQVSPNPTLNAAIGLVLGILLGVGLAVLRETLDTRVRSTDEIGRVLRLPLLARLPSAAIKRKRGAKLVMLDDPETVEAEAFRFLRTNFSVANLTHGAKVVMVTSAIEQEGKSTVAANLALALARAGSRVALVDLDLRRPSQRRILELPDGAGFTEVALGKVRLERAVHRMTLVDPERTQRGKNLEKNGSGGMRELGFVEVLTTGALPRGVGEFVGSSNTVGVLEQLRKRVDIILIDAPPMLRVGDAAAMLPNVDAVLVVTRLSFVRRALLGELRRTLKNATAPALGVVVTGVPKEETFTGAYGTTYEPVPRQPVT